MTERERKNLVTRVTMPLHGVVVVVTNDPEYLRGTTTLAKLFAEEAPDAR